MDKMDLFFDIVEWGAQDPGASYYDMKAYAYDNNKDDWLALLKDSEMRKKIADCYRDFYRPSGYNHTKAEGMRLAAEAEKRYWERRCNPINKCSNISK